MIKGFWGCVSSLKLHPFIWSKIFPSSWQISERSSFPLCVNLFAWRRCLTASRIRSLSVLFAYCQVIFCVLLVQAISSLGWDCRAQWLRSSWWNAGCEGRACLTFRKVPPAWGKLPPRCTSPWMNLTAPCLLFNMGRSSPWTAGRHGRTPVTVNTRGKNPTTLESLLWFKETLCFWFYDAELKSSLSSPKGKVDASPAISTMQGSWIRDGKRSEISSGYISRSNLTE